MKATTLLAAFLGGAIVGAGSALLFTPEKGEDLREQIKDLLKKYHICSKTQEEKIDELVDELAAEVHQAPVKKSIQ